MSVTPRPALRRYGGLLAGLALFFVFLFLPPPDGVDLAAWRVAAMAILMAVWWMTEAIPVYATGLLPLVLLPFLGVSSMGDAAAPYATPVIFLFMGGFMLALAMQKWGLHKRIALNLLKRTGTRASYLILGFMATAAFLSMWVSNTATAVMMVPIALSVLSLLTSETRVG